MDSTSTRLVFRAASFIQLAFRARSSFQMAKNPATVHQGRGGGRKAERVSWPRRVRCDVSALVDECLGNYSSDTFFLLLLIALQ